MPRSRAVTNGVTGGKPRAISVASVELNQGPLRRLRHSPIFVLRFCTQALVNVFCGSYKLRNITVIVVLIPCIHPFRSLPRLSSIFVGLFFWRSDHPLC